MDMADRRQSFHDDAIAVIPVSFDWLIVVNALTGPLVATVNCQFPSLYEVKNRERD